VAKHVFVYLCRVFRDLFDHYRKETLCPLNERLSFYSGLEKGFSQKLYEERRVHEQRSGSAGTALMVIDADLDRALRERYRDLQHATQRVNVYAGSHAAGVQQGRKITLREPVEGKGQLALGRA
jgi:hypothetical protein